jgi:sugar/nucleoside kinase (ribokinase family)
VLTFIGAALWDYLFAVPALPTHGQSLHAELLGSNPAGTAANSAAYVASLDERVTLISRVGDDELGQRYRARCAQLPTLSTLWLPADGPTKLCTIFITPDGERTFVSASASEKAVAADTTPAVETALANTDILWLTTTDTRKRELYTALCPGKHGLPLQYHAQEADTGHHWDYVVGSAEDAATPDLTTLKDVELCVITMGAAGGLYSQAGAVWQRFSAVSAASVVDTCGAGDAFLAGLLAGLHRQYSAEDAIALGSRCGAKAVTQHGSWPTVTSDDA